MYFVYKLLHSLVKCNLGYLILFRFLQIFTILEVIASNSKTQTHLIIRLNYFVIGWVNNWKLLSNNILC